MNASIYNFSFLFHTHHRMHQNIYFVRDSTKIFSNLIYLLIKCNSEKNISIR